MCGSGLAWPITEARECLQVSAGYHDLGAILGGLWLCGRLAPAPLRVSGPPQELRKEAGKWLWLPLRSLAPSWSICDHVHCKPTLKGTVLGP